MLQLAIVGEPIPQVAGMFNKGDVVILEKTNGLLFVKSTGNCVSFHTLQADPPWRFIDIPDDSPLTIAVAKLKLEAEEQ